MSGAPNTKMSYAPATKLSHSNGTQCATVLSNNNIIVTKGFAYEKIMPLEDWLILAEKNAITAKFSDAERQRRAEENLAHAGAMWSKAYAEEGAKAKAYVSQQQDRQKRAEADLAHAGAMWSKARAESSTGALWAALGIINNDIVNNDVAPSPLISANEKLEAERDAAAKASMVPLTGTTDGEKLYELESRFKGAEFVLTTDINQVVVFSTGTTRLRYIVVAGDERNLTYSCFADIPGSSKMKPALMAEYLGLYIDLSHLF